MVQSLKSTLLLLVILAMATQPVTSKKWLRCFDCPTSDSYDPECVNAVTPPWPICLLHSTDSWVEKSKEGSERCCGDDISECKCPYKDTSRFKEKIGKYCDGVAKCGHDNSLELPVDGKESYGIPPPEEDIFDEEEGQIIKEE